MSTERAHLHYQNETVENKSSYFLIFIEVFSGSADLGSISKTDAPELIEAKIKIIEGLKRFAAPNIIDAVPNVIEEISSTISGN